jgi:thiosulfate/3-mercaptopyruvate sulfurtransferase
MRVDHRFSPLTLLAPAVLMCLLACSRCCSADREQPRLVDTNWLEQNLTSPKLRIVDVREKVQDYWAGHVPGSVYLSPDAIRLPDRGVPVMLAPAAVLSAVLGTLGVERDSCVVIYAEKSDFKAAYLLWALDYLGHSRSCILDGGFGKWTAEARPVTQDYPRIQPANAPTKYRTDSDLRARLDDVIRAVAKGDPVLLDVRPLPLYSGEQGSWKRKGHIPGAIHLYWGETLDEDGTWKSPDALREAYAKIGVTSDRSVIVSCGQGQMSAHTYFTLRHLLGFRRVSNYDGGFNEWSNIDALPVETGARGQDRP